MIILGIESTAHTFGVGIVDDSGNVLANEFDSYSSASEGMIIEEVVEHHKKVAEEVLTKALEESGVSWEEIDLVAYSAGPGLDPVLWVGYKKAKEWASANGKKLIGVNHCCAHLSVGKKVNGLTDPVYLYVSGVNTQVIVFDGGKYRVMGETLDIGLGNMLDKLGRVLGLGFPAGLEIEKLALSGEYVELPYVVKGMDVSFSGILTKCQQLFEKSKLRNSVAGGLSSPVSQNQSTAHPDSKERKGTSEGVSKEDLCFSVQEICFAMMAEVSERALAHTGKKELLLVGGVGANQKFCSMLDKMCQERGAKFSKVSMDLARDNGAMIAWEGYLRREQFGDEKIRTFWRVDEV